MDNNSSLCGTSIFEGNNSEATFNSISSWGDHNQIEKLSTDLSDKLKINDVQKTPVERYYIEEEAEEEDGLFISEESFFALKKEPPKHEPMITTPISDLNLVSAFKGSREKEGKPAKGVSWAPDVYDPRPRRRKKKQKVKNRQKGGGKRVNVLPILLILLGILILILILEILYLCKFVWDYDLGLFDLLLPFSSIA